jgi:hypothetical protein
VALFFAGKTTCSRCGKIVESGRDAILFPAFLRRDHRLGKFSDAVFHKTCYGEWPDRTEFEAIFQRYRQIWDSRPKGLKTIEEIEAWGREAFREFLGPPESAGD